MFVPVAGVGATGTPVNVGLTVKAKVFCAISPPPASSKLVEGAEFLTKLPPLTIPLKSVFVILVFPKVAVFEPAPMASAPITISLSELLTSALELHPKNVDLLIIVREELLEVYLPALSPSAVQ